MINLLNHKVPQKKLFHDYIKQCVCTASEFGTYSDQTKHKCIIQFIR